MLGCGHSQTWAQTSNTRIHFAYGQTGVWNFKRLLWCQLEKHDVQLPSLLCISGPNPHLPHEPNVLLAATPAFEAHHQAPHLGLRSGCPFDPLGHRVDCKERGLVVAAMHLEFCQHIQSRQTGRDGHPLGVVLEPAFADHENPARREPAGSGLAVCLDPTPTNS